MADLKINSHQSLEAFLEKHPKFWASVIAVRAAQRSVVFLGKEGARPDLILAAFRATLIAEQGDRVQVAWAADAAEAARSAHSLLADHSLHAIAIAVNTAARPSLAMEAGSAVRAAFAAFAHAAGYAADAEITFWSAIQEDCRVLLEDGLVVLTDDDGQTVLLDDDGETVLTDDVGETLTNDDGVALTTGRPVSVSTRPLWPDGQPTCVEKSHHQLIDGLGKVGGQEWLLWTDWYTGVLTGNRGGAFNDAMHSIIANQPPEFWGDGKNQNSEPAYWGKAVDNPRTPDDVVADIARLTGWPESVRDEVEAPVLVADDDEFDTTRIPDQDPAGPQLSETLPITPERDGGAPIEIRDRDYYHRSMTMQAEALLETCMRSDGSVYQSCTRIHMHTNMFAWALGETPGDIYSTALENEAAILQEVLDLDEKLKAAEASGDIVEGDILRGDTASGLRALLGTYEKRRENERVDPSETDQTHVPPENADKLIRESFGLPQIMREAEGAFDPGLIDHYDAAQEDAAREQRLGRLGRGARYLQHAVTNLAIATVRAVAGALVTAGRLVWKGGVVVLGATAANVAAAVISPGVITAMQKIATASGNPHLIAYADFIARAAGLVR